MVDINRVLENIDNRNNEKNDEILRKESLTDTILRISSELDKYKPIREKINSLKEEKDKFVLEYIESIEQPKRLDLGLISYKALFFYFQEGFINSKKTKLKFTSYENNIDEVSEERKDSFKELFSGNEIHIIIKDSNFPHLIGYKTRFSTDNKEFLRKIFYETTLIADFEEHSCKKDKIETFSWILVTLAYPSFVFNSKGIKQSKVKADIYFVRKMKKTYHYVALKRIPSKKGYVINSHHPLSEFQFNKMFDTNKKIFRCFTD